MPTRSSICCALLTWRGAGKAIWNGGRGVANRRFLCRPTTTLLAVRENSEHGLISDNGLCGNITQISMHQRAKSLTMSSNPCNNIRLHEISETSIIDARLEEYPSGLGQQSSMHSEYSCAIRPSGKLYDAEQDTFSDENSKCSSNFLEEGGGDPKFNISLARLIAEAKSKDMPNNSIENAIKLAMTNKDTGSRLIVEARGPRSCLWIIETFTDKPKRTKQEIQAIVKKFSCAVRDHGSVMTGFEKKGVIHVSPAESEPDLDQYMEVAIEAGAEEVELILDEDGNKVLEFICDPPDLHSVKKELEGRQLEVKSADFHYNPQTFAQLGPEELETVEKLVQKLHEHPDVLKVFDNIDMSA